MTRGSGRKLTDFLPERAGARWLRLKAEVCDLSLRQELVIK
jgi:hypothetical protein